jgi:hypothetical protein
MTTESSIRRKAARCGYVVRKSREWKYVPRPDNHGDYMLIEANRNRIVLGEKFDATLDDIETELKLLDWADGGGVMRVEKTETAAPF